MPILLEVVQEAASVNPYMPYLVGPYALLVASLIAVKVLWNSWEKEKENSTKALEKKEAAHKTEIDKKDESIKELNLIIQEMAKDGVLTMNNVVRFTEETQTKMQEGNSDIHERVKENKEAVIGTLENIKDELKERQEKMVGILIDINKKI
ncbi:MAG: hypothetical protein F6K19_01430 [Cyanothece sp. SIO1E1]|nr:hypothetical protein [Cyanothece sp. SIO1E1]